MGYVPEDTKHRGGGGGGANSGERRNVCWFWRGQKLENVHLGRTRSGYHSSGTGGVQKGAKVPTISKRGWHLTHGQNLTSTKKGRGNCSTPCLALKREAKPLSHPNGQNLRGNYRDRIKWGRRLGGFTGDNPGSSVRSFRNVSKEDGVASSSGKQPKNSIFQPPGGHHLD